jgi:DNA-binding transcriptional ArsR family regulator
MRPMDVVPEFAVEEAARRFALLGDPTRPRVVSALQRRGEACVSDLASDCNASASNTSQHLQRLLLDGIVKRRRQGGSR